MSMVMINDDDFDSGDGDGGRGNECYFSDGQSCDCVVPVPSLLLYFPS